MTVDLLPPVWLIEKAPDAVDIWNDVIARLQAKGKLENANLEAAAAYAYCLSRAAYWDRLGPGRVRVVPKVKRGQNPVVEVWRRSAQFAANQLGGLLPVKPVDFLELLLDDQWEELDESGNLTFLWRGEATYYLNAEWEV
jgi:hypothetical protein